MGRHGSRGAATHEQVLTPLQEQCQTCGQRLWIAYHHHRTVVRLDGLWRLTIRVRHCQTPTCSQYHHAVIPGEAGAWALPQGEFGLDVIALVGQLRAREQRSVPQIHQTLRERGVEIAERSVTVLLHRYEELVALHLADPVRLRKRLAGQGGVILALDGLQPDVGHEVLWVLRDVVSGEILLARSLLGATADDLVPLLEEVQAMLMGKHTEEEIRIRGVISDGQTSIRHAVARALPGVPHQLCQFHYLREAAKPIFEADRHAKKELKKRVRGVRPIERSLEGQTGAPAEAARGYCLAVRSALADDGRPPLAASGLKLKARLAAVVDSLERVEQAGVAEGSPHGARADQQGQGGEHRRSLACCSSCAKGCRPPPRCGPPSRPATPSSTTPPICWPTPTSWMGRPCVRSTKTRR